MSKRDNLSKRRSNLSPEKQALLKKWTRGESKTQLNVIPQRKEQGSPPLSFAQQRLWFLDQLDPNSIYNISIGIRLTGKVNIAALEQSLKETVLRHEVLRTTFAVVNGQPVQVIHSAPTFTLSMVDLRYLPDIKQETEAKQVATEATQSVFDLSNGPLLRTTLLWLDEEEYILLLVMHHIVTDGWSMEIFIREASTLYQALCAEEPKPLPALPIQYADFACWQRQWLSGEVLKTQLNYWQQQLAGAPPVLELPTDRPRPPRQTFRGSTLKFQLSSNLEQKLLAVSQNSDTTLFMTLLAAFVTLLGRYSNQSDIVIGSPIANRNRSEIEPLIGFFVNTLMLRIDLKENPSFSELLAQVRQVCLDAYAHQDMPFEQVVEALQPERSLSYAPLFQVMFVLQNAPMPKLQLPDLTLLPLPIESATAKFDLTLVLENTSDGLIGSVEYSTDLFDAATIVRIVGHYQTLLEAVVVNPYEKLLELPLLSAAEQNQILVEWNETQVSYPEEICLHRLFEQQVELTPQAIAVVFEDQRLTYRELNTQANKIAHYLLSLGVGPEVLVGVCVDRSVEMVVALLGILKAGGAYVPVDPEYPKERIAYMLCDSQVKVLLTQSKLLAALGEQQAHLVCLDTNWQEICEESSENPSRGVLPHHLAYVIYTSGSTGKPKGAMNTHQGVCNRLEWMQQAYQITATDAILQKTPFSFDVSVWEFFWPLIVGARLVVAQPGGHRDSAYLVKLIASEEITTLHFVPSMLQVFLEEQNLESCSCLRQVFCSGEALPKELQEKFFGRLGCNLHNLYGPTEAAIDVTYWQCLPESELSSVPIGRPIANTQIYILDRNHQPVPVGVAGELHIGGVGLARGYLNRPELTAEKFIPNPFAETPSDRLYKTGDLVRHLRDGNIEYLGRIDHQVKVRGFRIELGEIEAVLSQHPNVQQSVVIATQEVVGTTQLVAYLVAHQQPAPQSGELRTFLRTKLPEYMVPSYFLVLDALPLTPNGKLDRRALPKPFGQPELATRFVAPRTPNEKILASIWASVLGIESVGIHDNFFELGGDSILSIQIVAKASSAGMQLSAKQMFEYQTIAELAAVVGTVAAIDAEQGVVSGTLPLTPIQQWFTEENFASPAHWNQALLLSMAPGVQPHLVEQVVHQLLVHHDALRLRFEHTDSGWQQMNAMVEQTVPLTVVDLSTLPQSQQTAAIEAKANELQASLNLSTGPLVQVAWFNLGEELNSRLLFVIHHLAVDGVSWRILLEDLHTAYSQLGAGAVIQLPAKTTAFKDWAQRQWEYVQQLEKQHHLDFWLAQSQQSVGSIPLDYVDGANSEASARTVSVSLSTEETRALLQEVPKAYNTQINDVLLTALAQVLADWTNSSYVRFNLEGHGREEIWDNVNVSRTVGWFTTLFPVVVQYTTEAPGEALKSIKEQLRCIPQQGMSYGWLRYLLDDAQISAQLTAQDSAQIVFNHLGQFDSMQKTSTLFQLADESSGASRSPHNHRSHLLEVNSIIIGAQLRVDWTYSENLHQLNTIENLAHEFLQALRGLITHCLAPDAGGFTPTDFPLAQLNNVVLEKLLSNVVSRQGISKTNWKNIADIYPLSSVQQGILFHTLYAPDSGVYCQQVSCTFTGALDVEAFSAAWQHVVQRHVVLRTAFTWEHSEQPLQIVYQQVKPSLEIHSWLGLSADEQQQQIQAFVESDAQRGFQLSLAPLMRLSLIQMSDDVYQFVWSYHHILIDGWSLPLVFKEVLGFYSALSVGQELQLPPSRSYREYIAWLQKQKLEVAEQFWRQTLQGVNAPTPLGIDKPYHSSSETQSYSEEILLLPKEATTALVSLARMHHLTLNILVQAAWAILLSRYSGEADVVFGVTVSGRSPAINGVESIVGLFINTLPMRVELTRDDTVLSKLKQIHEQQVEISTYEYTPLVEIHRMSDVPLGLPLFESIVVFENYPVDAALQQHSLNLHIGDVRTIERTNYPLNLVAQPGEQLSLRFIYDTQRFERASVTRMMEHFQTLLQNLVANPNQKLSHIEMLSAAEKNQILVEWNETQVSYPEEICLHTLFEQQVQKTPNAIAVVFEDQRLTYSELNAQANQLAHYLQGLGVEPEMLVGVCVERSIQMVVGLLGILKAGGAYVPMDPEYPQERLGYMLSDSQVKVLLTEEKFVSRLAQQQAQLVCLDTNWRDISEESTENPISAVLPHHLAYVIYTSGSTGKPKGAMNTHQGVCNRLEWMQSAYQITEEDRILQKTPFSFDVSVWEFFWPLIVGARLVVAQPGGHRDSAYLVKLIATEQITTLHFVPSMLQVFLEEPHLESCNCLRQVFCSGEALSPELLEKFFARLECNLHNLYGPTEAAIDVTYWQCQQDSKLKTVPIGRPIANTQIYILDRDNQPVPVGVAGELHIGGVGLARGYLNRPELTAEKFIPNPFAPTANSRLYKTGDLVRHLIDGNIEYLGRMDYQVKVRGFRIELGEIEAALSQHPNVRHTVAIATQEMGNTRLVAYLVADQQPAPQSSELRAFLKQQLPEYMVPSAFVALEALPLTPNGKLDRRALPKPFGQPELSKSFVAPRTAIEEILASIWASVLGIESVGIYDNFFELGGDSILTIQIIAKASSAGVQLSAKQMFEYPTIAELATVASTVAAIEAEQGVVSGTLPLTPIQQWFFSENFSTPPHWNQALLLSMPANIEPSVLEQVVHYLLVHHDALRLRFERTDSEWRQVNALRDDTIPFSVVDLSAIPQPQQPEAIEAKATELQGSLNLSTGPLVRVAWLFLGEQFNSRLLIVIHHLAVDGVSWRILLEDLHIAYAQLKEGRAIQLPAKTTSFKQWAQYQWEYAQSQDLSQERDFWLGQSLEPVANIPVDYPDGVNNEASACTVSMSLSTEETRALLQEVPKAYNTQINDVLLTALVEVLADWTNSSYVRFNLEGHGREEIWENANVSRTVGWFTTMFPVVLHYTTDEPGEALKSIKEQLRRIPQQGMSYGWLRYLLSDTEIAPQLNAQGPAQIIFNHLGQFDAVLQTSALFQLASESSGASRSPRNHRSHLLEVNSMIVGAQLRVDWTYSENLHHSSTIKRFAQQFLQALRGLIAHCLAPDAGGFTPTDFPLAQLNSVVLEQLLSNVVSRQGIAKTNWKNIADIYPLSSVQQGILFHTLYAPDSGVYCQQLICTFTGQLDVEFFATAWQHVVQRHVVLRTAFTWEHSELPLQVVFQQVKLPLEIHSWIGLSPQEQQQQLQAFIEADGQRGFQLSKAPLMRLSLIQMSDDVYQFVWSYHHILIDGWSLPLVFKEVLGFYSALSVGQELQLPPSRSYREYIAWLQKQKLEVAEQFWRQTLLGVTSPTSLVVDRTYQSSSAPSYSEEILELPRAGTTALISLARQHQLTLNTLVQAAWAMLLWRYSGESNVVFGVTVSGRTAANGVESIVGLLINTLPMRVELSCEDSVLSKLKQIQMQQIEISQYEYTPLVQIQGWTDVPRGLPLFESIVVFENYPVDAALQQHSLNLHIGDVRAIERTNYPLTLIAQPGEQLSLRFIYDTQRFDRATIARMADHFQTLLEGIIANPARQLSDIPLLTATEQNQLLVEWNNTQADYPKQVCLHTLFEQQVQKTPNAVAVVFEDEQLTYSELNALANQLAHHLQSLGVGPEVLVGICTERSTLMVVGLLAILKAGGAYVPLDPIYPPERLAYILSDSGVQVLLTQQSVADRLPDVHGHVVYLDSDWPTHQSSSNPNSNVCALNLAYAIYTSGSTGRPKGVQISHRAVVNFLSTMSAQPGMGSSDVMVAVTTITFDIAALELFLPLSLGARLVLTRDLMSDGGQSIAALGTSCATVMQGTPATWRALMQAGFLGNPQLKILCGGEALDPELAAQLLERGDSLWNMYGPTETTIWSAVSSVQAGSGSVSIGRAIANTQFYILDANLQPVPVGVAGELHIGGDGLARGYLSRPELTAEKFIPNPFGDGGSRLYKTGDLVRYLADGNIEYLGRIDNQVKVRGFRIELPEIEALLSQHSTLQQAVVIAKEIAQDKRLVAYLVPQIEASPAIGELRDFLLQQLPEYMVPSYFVVLDALPLTPNGKVDRNALPDPDHTKLEVEAYVAPRNEVERLLSAVWQEILNTEKVGVNDNFFELGGHSLLIVQLHSKLHQKLLGNINRNISVVDLFKYPTISALAQYFGQEQNVEAPTRQKINDRASKQIKALKRQPLIKQRKKTNG